MQILVEHRSVSQNTVRFFTCSDLRLSGRLVCFYELQQLSGHPIRSHYSPKSVFADAVLRKSEIHKAHRLAGSSNAAEVLDAGYVFGLCNLVQTLRLIGLGEYAGPSLNEIF